MIEKLTDWLIKRRKKQLHIPVVMGSALFLIELLIFKHTIMCQSSSGTHRVQKWYNKNIFSLIPLLEIRKANEHNTSGFTFRWLFITLWTIDSPSFEIAIVADTHWGFGLVGLFPYFRWCISIPCPEKIGSWINKHFSRSRHISF